MDLPRIVAKARVFYHLNMLDIYNVADQLGIIKDWKVEAKMKHHTMETLDAVRILKRYTTIEEMLEHMNTKKPK